MSRVLHFTIPGQPVGKGRHRVRSIGRHSQMYTPEKTANYEGMVAMCAYQAMAGQELFVGPVAVCMTLGCAIPASWSKKKREQAEQGRIRPTTKPDMDNVVKAVFDAMNGVVWTDDVQVVDLQSSKFYATAPRVTVSVTEAA